MWGRRAKQSGEGRWTWLVLASQAQIILRAYVIFTFEFWVGGVAVLSSPNISQDLTTLRQKGNFCTKNYNCTIMLTFLARKLQYLGIFTIQLFWILRFATVCNSNFTNKIERLSERARKCQVYLLCTLTKSS